MLPGLVAAATHGAAAAARPSGFELGASLIPPQAIQRVDAQGRLREPVRGWDFEIRYERAHRGAEVFDTAGQPLPGVTTCWFAWRAFNQNTSVPPARWG